MIKTEMQELNRLTLFAFKAIQSKSKKQRKIHYQSTLMIFLRKKKLLNPQPNWFKKIFKNLIESLKAHSQ
jgi:hypothetical protein